VPEPLSVCAFLLAFEAVPALLDELAEDEFCRFQLIFIASRHGGHGKNPAAHLFGNVIG
jgi:hypothetical protein